MSVVLISMCAILVLIMCCRLEPVGVLVFSVIMITAFAQVGLESISRLIDSSREVLEL